MVPQVDGMAAGRESGVLEVREAGEAGSSALVVMRGAHPWLLTCAADISHEGCRGHMPVSPEFCQKVVCTAKRGSSVPTPSGAD